MSFKNYLDLRKKISPQIKIVERVIIKKRSTLSNLLIALAAVLVSTGMLWGISKADDFVNQLTSENLNTLVQGRTFSTRGRVLEINENAIVISNAKNPEGETGFSYFIDFKDARIKSYQNDELSIDNIKIDQEIVAKGVLENETIKAHTIIIFNMLSSELPDQVIPADDEQPLEQIAPDTKENESPQDNLTPKQTETLNTQQEAILNLDELSIPATVDTVDEQPLEQIVPDTEENTSLQDNVTSEQTIEQDTSIKEQTQ